MSEIQSSLFPDMELSREPAERQPVDDYEAFCEKFKAKKTTDDCYTPPEIYDCIRDWVLEKNPELRGRNIVRPFQPGGDYTKYPYKPGDLVLDNPPFSILAKIREWYCSQNIDYFLFAPALTTVSSIKDDKECFILAFAPIIYENGANVATSFITNCWHDASRIIIAGDLYKLIENVNKKAKATKQQGNYKYPDSVLCPAHVGRLTKREITMSISREDCYYTKNLNMMRVKGKSVFGGCFLLSERAAAERAAAERAAAERAEAEVITLSSLELEIIKKMGNKVDGNSK